MNFLTRYRLFRSFYNKHKHKNNDTLSRTKHFISAGYNSNYKPSKRVNSFFPSSFNSSLYASSIIFPLISNF